MPNYDVPPAQRRPIDTLRGLLKAGGVLLGVVGCCAVLLIANLDRGRTAVPRMRDANNCKQLAFAGIIFESDYVGLAGPYAIDEDGEVCRELSFRVGLLPYLEEHNLYARIDLAKAWDAPENAAATSTPINTLQSPVTPDPATPDTPYRVFYGGGALFEADGSPVKLAKIPDGASNTILFVHAAEAVPWAKPAEFAYTPSTPLPPLGSKGLGDGFNAAMADGSVRWFKNPVAEATLRGLIEKADGRGAGLD